jgi:hypothetical protein
MVEARTRTVSAEALILGGLLLLGRRVSGAVGRHQRFIRRHRPGRVALSWPTSEHDTRVAD